MSTPIFPPVGARVVTQYVPPPPTSPPSPDSAFDRGDTVVVETTDGRIFEGKLLDKLPAGYLFRIQDRTEMIPYEKIRSIGKSPVAAPPPTVYTPPQPAPVPAKSSSPSPSPVSQYTLRRYREARITIVGTRSEHTSQVSSSSGSGTVTPAQKYVPAQVHTSGTTITSGSTVVAFQWRILRGGVAEMSHEELINASGDVEWPVRIAEKQRIAMQKYQVKRKATEDHHGLGGLLLATSLIAISLGGVLMLMTIPEKNKEAELSEDPWRTIGGVTMGIGSIPLFPAIGFLSEDLPKEPEIEPVRLTYDQARMFADRANARTRKTLGLSDEVEDLIKD